MTVSARVFYQIILVVILSGVEILNRSIFYGYRLLVATLECSEHGFHYGSVSFIGIVDSRAVLSAYISTLTV